MGKLVGRLLMLAIIVVVIYNLGLHANLIPALNTLDRNQQLTSGSRNDATNGDSGRESADATSTDMDGANESRTNAADDRSDDAGGSNGSGSAGSTGLVESTGPTESVGSSGSAGSTSSIGPTGSVGSSGSAESAGPSGSAGSTSSIGPTGSVESTGSAGPTAGGASLDGVESYLGIGDKEVPEQFGQLLLEAADAFKTRSDKFSLSYKGDKNELSEHMTGIIRAALSHDHYVAYILDSYQYTIRTWGNRSTITIEAQYRETKEQTQLVEQRVKEVLGQIVSSRMNEHEKVKAIHDWVVENVEYDQSLQYYTAYDALFRGKAVCQGYSLLGYKMLQAAGIPVIIAEGSVDTGEHAWNMVRLDGHWYHLDLTWDDPVGAENSAISYRYYFKTDKELAFDHLWTKSYPKADMRYLDYIRERESDGSSEDQAKFNRLKLALGLHFMEPAHTVESIDQLREAIRSAVRSRVTDLQFRYVDGDQFPAALKSAFEHLDVSVGYKVNYESYSSSDQSIIVNMKLEY